MPGGVAGERPVKAVPYADSGDCGGGEHFIAQ
jgi:hypothetical protein